jgi:hypothetical protein
MPALKYWDGTAWQTIPGGAPNPPLVSALPSSPIDGQEVYFAADAANGVIWHLRYRAASASAYKWEFLGGAPLVHRIDTDEQLAAGTAAYVDAPTVGPTLTTPLAGDYIYDAGFGCYTGSTTTTVSVTGSVHVAGTPHGPAQAVTTDRSATTSCANRANAVAAAAVIKLMYLRNVTYTQNFRYRYLKLHPVRVG